MAKIAIVSRGWWPAVIGGSEKFMYRLGEQLYRLGHEVVGITRRFRGQREPKAIHRLIVMDQRIKAPIISSYLFSRWAAKTVNRIKPDIAIVNSYWGETSPTKISREIPLIAVIHDVGLFTSSIAKRYRLRHFLRTRALKGTCGRADIIVTPTEIVKEELIKYLKVDEGKIRVIGFEGVDGPFKQIYVDNGFFDILQVGRFSPNKAQHITIEAFKLVAKIIDRANLWLVGGRGIDRKDLEYLESIRKMARDINRELGREAIRIVVDAEDISEYYRIADVCVIPSIAEEGYGLVPLECMAYGKPVVASEIFLETGAISRDISFVIPIGDPKSLAHELINIYRNLDKATEVGLKALKYASKFSWENIGVFFDNLIKSYID